MSDRRLLAVLFAGLLLAGCLAPGADDPAELDRTWREAHVVVPVPGVDGRPARFVEGRMQDVAGDLADMPDGVRLPLVIYLHGCAGLHGRNRADARLLAEAGFAVIAPDSFARLEKPERCDWRRRRADMRWNALFYRLAEARHAHARARALPWVDPGRIALVGQSEGGMATARYRGDGLAARVIMAWTCALPVPGYGGVAGPREVPVLALVSARDPWFDNWLVAGDCGDALQGYRDSRSAVVDASAHHVLSLPEAQAAVLDFLATHLQPPPGHRQKEDSTAQAPEG